MKIVFLYPRVLSMIGSRKTGAGRGANLASKLRWRQISHSEIGGTT